LGSLVSGMNFYLSRRFLIFGLALSLISSSKATRVQQTDRSEGAPREVARDLDPSRAVEPVNRVIARKLQLIGFPNFGEVSPQIFRGGQPSSEGIKGLAKMDVDIIVNLRPGDHLDEENETTHLGMLYVFNSLAVLPPK
jgi:hypothetical protein